MTENRAVVQLRHWSGRNRLSTQLWHSTLWRCWPGCFGMGLFVTMVVSLTSQLAWAIVCRLRPLCGGDSVGAARVKRSEHRTTAENHVLPHLLQFLTHLYLPTRNATQ